MLPLCGCYRHDYVEHGKLGCHADDAIFGGQSPPSCIYVCVWRVISPLQDYFYKSFFSRGFLCKAAVSTFLQGTGSEWFFHIGKDNVEGKSLGRKSFPHCAFFQELQTLFLIRFSLPVDESPHASYGGALFDPWQFHFSITGVFTSLQQCAAFPLP